MEEEDISIPPIWSQVAFVLPLFVQLFLLHPDFKSSSFARLTRIALVPVSILLCLRHGQMSTYRPKSIFFAINFVNGVVDIVGIMKAIEFGIVQGPYYWLGVGAEKKSLQKETQIEHPASFVEKLYWTAACAFNFRGIGWSWGVSEKKLPPSIIRRGHPYKFLFLEFGRVIFYHFAVIFTLSYIIGVARLGVYNVPVFPKFSQLKQSDTWIPPSTALTVLFMGCAIWCGLELIHAVMALFYTLAVTILRSLPGIPQSLCPNNVDPRMWRPLFGPRPYKATSLATFWSYHWHALFLRCFTVCGIWPAQVIFTPIFGRKFAGIVGLFFVFLISGLLHEYGIYFASFRPNPELDHLSTYFFTAFAFLVALEIGFTKITGHKVHGVLGWIWCMTCMISLGHLLYFSWLGRGLTDSMVPCYEWEGIYKWFVPLGIILPIL